MKKWAKSTFSDLRDEFDQRRSLKSSDVDKSSNRRPPPPPPNKPSNLRANPAARRSRPHPVTASDISRYRYQYGTNLGSIFVLEKWMFGNMFPESATGSSEYDAVSSSIKSLGFEATADKFRKHWQNALTDADFKFLTESAHINTIRLPIGYFTLGAEFCRGTPFADPAISKVYAPAWDAVLDVISRCGQHGIGVLIDFHALPGGANKDSHSGTSSGRADLWTSRSHQDLAISCLNFIATEVSSHRRPDLASAVIGLQICNEAMWAAPNLHAFYDRTIDAISRIDPTLPLYISDAWNLSSTLQYALSKNRLLPPDDNRSCGCQRPTNPIIIDTHKYWTFSPTDRSKSPQQIISEVESTQFPPTRPSSSSILSPPSSQSKIKSKPAPSTAPTATSIFIGEYSATLSASTWSLLAPSSSSSSSSSSRADLTRAFALAQTRLYTPRRSSSVSGCAFWSYKFSWANHAPGARGLVHTDGGDWGFRNQVDHGALAPPRALTLASAQVERVLARARQELQQNGGGGGGGGMWQRARAEHVATRRSGDDDDGGQGAQFSRGWTQGFSDATGFFGGRRLRSRRDHENEGVAGADIIGALDLWILKRVAELSGSSGSGSLEKRDDDDEGEEEEVTWEWEQGFRRGVRDFESLIEE